jgi:hypothetical protein
VSDKIVLVTPPDDILQDGIRLLLVDLNTEQTNILSEALKELAESTASIVYIWHSLTDDVEWLLDKKHKSDVIFFNAASDNDLIIGYLAAQPNSHYFETLKSLHIVNSSAIYNTDQIINILETIIKQNEKR